jgi:hypothetical protein
MAFMQTKKNRRRRIRTGAAAALALILLAMTGIVNAQSAAPKRTLRSDLLTATQVPKSWIVPVRHDVVRIKCLASILVTNGAASASTVQAVFGQDGSLPAVAEKLGSYANASSAYAKAVATLAGCRHLGGTINGFNVTGAVTPMRTRRYGADSQAFHASISMLGVSAAIDVQVIRKGGVIMWLDAANFPPVNVAQFKGLIAKAYARIP